MDHYERFVLALDEPPILIGHGIGGLVVQALLDRGLGICGVAVASAPIRGIWTLPYTTMRVVTPQLINPRSSRRSVALTPAQFHYAFMNTSSREEAQRTFERYAVPGPRRVLLQAELANFNPFAETAINVRRNNRAPLLMIAASQDHLAPPSWSRPTRVPTAIRSATTEYKEFPGRTHFIIAQSGWQEVANYTLDWARDQELLKQREAAPRGARNARAPGRLETAQRFSSARPNADSPMMSMRMCAKISGHSCRVRAYDEAVQQSHRHDGDDANRPLVQVIQQPHDGAHVDRRPDAARLA